MAVSITNKDVVATMSINLNGVDLKTKVQKLEYLVHRAQSQGNGPNGTITLELIVDPKSRELSHWLIENNKALSGVITCKNTMGEIVRTISFADAFPKAFSEAVDLKNSAPLLSKVVLDVARIAVT